MVDLMHVRMLTPMTVPHRVVGVQRRVVGVLHRVVGVLHRVAGVLHRGAAQGLRGTAQGSAHARAHGNAAHAQAHDDGVRCDQDRGPGKVAQASTGARLLDSGWWDVTPRGLSQEGWWLE